MSDNDPISKLAQGIANAGGLSARDVSVLDVGSDHDYECRCQTCLEWWRLIGPGGDEPGNYGPFTQDEVEGK